MPKTEYTSLKKPKPTTPGQRAAILINYRNTLTPQTKPHRALLRMLNYSAGRNNQGKITVRHRGGRVKRKWRVIDFKRDKDNIPAKVVSIEYDPNRSANISLISYLDGEKRYILHPSGLKVGDTVISGKDSDIKPGNALPLSHIPEGTRIHNIELIPGAGGILSRAAGSSAQLLGRSEEERYMLVKTRSGEVRKILANCKATIGVVGNEQHLNINLGKAGKKRYLGFRPTVRGSAMNPVDHPHGGGEGKQPIGRKTPLSPWSKPALGFKTRSAKKPSTRLIVRGRPRERGK